MAATFSHGSTMSSLLLIDDDRSTIRIIQRCFEQTNIKVFSSTSGAEAAKATARLQPDVVILDILLPDQSGLCVCEEIRRQDPNVPIILVTASGTSDTAIESMRLGAMDYLSKPLDVAQIREVVARAIAIGNLTRATLARDEPGDFDTENPAGATSSDALIGHCPAMQEVYKAIGRVTGQNINVVIRGESGTGKELVARAIHRHSPRVGKKFLTVNCAAIPEDLLESELFGHEKGAFTGAASQRIGKLEECDGGTLFLDEVGDMPVFMQSKILRATQEKEFQRVGGNQTIRSDTRIVAASNRDLDAMAASGEFRSDLYYRLNGYTLVLPPLRARRDDIPILVEYYLRRFNSEMGKTISSVARETMELLTRHAWPGNIRELQTVIKRAILHAVGPVLVPEFLPAELRESIAEFPAPAPADLTNRRRATLGDASDVLPVSRDTAFREFVENRLRRGTGSLYADSVKYMECSLLTNVLRFANGIQSRAALLLGITRGCLRNKLREHQITIGSSIGIQDSTMGSSEMEANEPVSVCLKIDALGTACGRRVQA
jgi:DNA-binding NtrC family response regulator